MPDLGDILRDTQQRRERDAKRWEELDGDLCMLCGAYGADKRSLFVHCFYAVHEVVPEAIDLFECSEDIRHRGYFLRICKSCRARFLGHLEAWRNECLALRGLSLDPDGYRIEDDPECNVPVRINGVTVLMTEAGYADWRAKRDAKSNSHCDA